MPSFILLYDLKVSDLMIYLMLIVSTCVLTLDSVHLAPHGLLGRFSRELFLMLIESSPSISSIEYMMGLLQPSSTIPFLE